MHSSYIGRKVILPEFDTILCKYLKKEECDAQIYFKVLGEVIE